MPGTRPTRTPRAKPRTRPGSAKPAASRPRQRAVRPAPVWVDAQEMAVLHPATFDAPSQAQLDAVRPGSLVKVSPNFERFWVKVLTVKGDRITGVIDNDLVCTDLHGLKCGDTVTFEKRHLYATEPPTLADALARGLIPS